MKMQRVSSPHLKEPAPGTWSNCRVYGNQFFIAGMTAGDGKGGVLGDGSMYDRVLWDSLGGSAAQPPMRRRTNAFTRVGTNGRSQSSRRADLTLIGKRFLL